LTRVKKWQCPHCPQDSTRRWNVAVLIRRAHGGAGDPVKEEKMSQHANSYPSGDGRPTQNAKRLSSYNHSNYLYTNHANKGTKGSEDIIDKWYQTVTDLQEKEHKINTIKEFYRTYPDAPMPIPNIDSSIPPIEKMLEQSLTKISCQNEPKNNPSSQIQGQNALLTYLTYLTYTRHKIASQNTGANGPLVASPSHNRDTHPQSIQSMSRNHDDKYNNRSGTVKVDDVDDRGFKITWTLKYNALGDLIDASHTDGLYDYITEQERRFEKRQHKSSSLWLFL
jgi:hypothetical protein